MTFLLNNFKKEYKAIDILPSLLLTLSFFLGGLREFNEWAVFSLIFIGVFLFFREKISIKKAGLWAVFALWIFISIFFSHTPAESFWQFSKYLLFFLFFCLTASSAESALKTWVILVFSFSFLSAIIVFYQAPEFHLLLVKNQNYTAAFLAACSGALVLFIVSVRSIKERLYSAALLIVFLAAMIIVRSRGALLAFISVSLLILIYRKHYKVFVFSLFLIAASIIFMPADLMAELLKIYDPNAFQRLNIWRAALEGIYLYPIWGYGAGGFEYLFSHLKFPAYDGISYFGHHARHAHSEILNIAAGSGIAASFIFIAAFVKSLKSEIKNNIYMDIVRVFAIAVFFQSCFDVIFYLGSINLLFFGSLGFVASFSNFKSEKNQKDEKIKTGILFFFAVILAGSLCIKQRHNDLPDCALNCAEPSSKRAALEKLSKFNLNGEIPFFENIKTKLLLNSNYALMLAHARYGERLYPSSWMFNFMQAEVYFKTLNYLKAKEKIRNTLMIEPNCLPARFMLAEILYDEGKFKAAFKEILRIEKILENSKELNPTGYNKALLRFDYDGYNILKNNYCLAPHI
ncbi:MAG: O-antigen ligase family protein [Elusimicrobia bacterium]|nr:O-antigen ligase family protein [Elusimicrobiota bacterium]